MLCVLILSFGPVSAYAQSCTLPDGQEGDIVYNASYNVPQYCNGTEWIAFGALNPSAGGAGCFNPTGVAGDLVYNNTHHVLQYCDGDDWRAVGGGAANGLSGPSGCAEIGDSCADGTVFAGWHPITHERMFIPPTDQGVFVWRSTGSLSYAADSAYDGKANTDVTPNSTDFPAFKACKDFTLGGHVDWYVPAISELDYLHNIRAALVAKGSITNFLDNNYWSSTQYGGADALRRTFGSPSVVVAGKQNSNRIRCLRRNVL